MNLLYLTLVSWTILGILIRISKIQELRMGKFKLIPTITLTLHPNRTPDQSNKKGRWCRACSGFQISFCFSIFWLSTTSNYVSLHSAGNFLSLSLQFRPRKRRTGRKHFARIPRPTFLRSSPSSPKAQVQFGNRLLDSWSVDLDSLCSLGIDSQGIFPSWILNCANTFAPTVRNLVQIATVSLRSKAGQ